MASTLTRPVLTLDTMEDAQGNRAADEFLEGLQSVEDAIQRHMDRYDGALPEGPYEVTLRARITASGETTRDLVWEVIEKLPKQSVQRAQKVRSRDGVLVAGMPARQRALPLERANVDQMAEILDAQDG